MLLPVCSTACSLQAGEESGGGGGAGEESGGGAGLGRRVGEGAGLGRRTGLALWCESLCGVACVQLARENSEGGHVSGF